MTAKEPKAATGQRSLTRMQTEDGTAPGFARFRETPRDREVPPRYRSPLVEECDPLAPAPRSRRPGRSPVVFARRPECTEWRLDPLYPGRGMSSRRAQSTNCLGTRRRALRGN